MEEEKKTTLNVISSFFKRSNKNQEAREDTTSCITRADTTSGSTDTTSSIIRADTTSGAYTNNGITCADTTNGITCADTSITTTNSIENSREDEEDEWILLLDERRANVQQISIFLILLGIALICFNYFDVVFAIFGKEGGSIISRTLNLGAAFVITVTGLIVRDNTREN